MATTKKPSTTVATVKKTSGNIVSIQDTLRAQAAAMAERVQPATGSFIRVTQDKQFQLPDGTKTHGPLELVIVDFVSKNMFYEGNFDPKNITPPACFSISANPRDMAPSANAPVPQASDCSTCPMNQFGSNGAGKACKNTKVLAVLPPDADESTPIWLLATSPTANKGFDGYVSSVARTFQMPPIGVVTTVGFDDNETYAKLTFTNPTPNPNLEVHFARQEEAKEMLLAEPDVSAYVKAPTPPARGKAGARR